MEEFVNLTEHTLGQIILVTFISSSPHVCYFIHIDRCSKYSSVTVSITSAILGVVTLQQCDAELAVRQ